MNSGSDLSAGQNVEAFIDEVIFLWLQRAAAVRAPNYTLSQLAGLDERLEAHIDGLRVAAEDGWRHAEEAVAGGGPADVFPAAVLALEAQDGRFEAILERVQKTPEARPGVISALGWVEAARIGPTVRALLRDANPFGSMLGLAACGVHRINPGARLAEALESSAGPVRARALRTVGELGQRDLLPKLLQALNDRNRSARFWAAWSAVRLGDRSEACVALERLATRPGERQQDALRLALVVCDQNAGHELLQNLAPSPDNQRLRIIGAGIIGHPRYLPWLIGQMEDPLLARLAAEAFVLMTGADFNREQMEVPPPEGFEDGPSDDPEDENVAVPEDLALPWPDAARIKAWWRENTGRFTAPARWFMGAPVSAMSCRAALKEGFQRQRRLAALHLAIINADAVQFNTSAPAKRQLTALAG
ncbi:MAG: TIGR02270 family protein [Acetobacteraceae bacterium]